MIGKMLSRYKVVAKLGEGGMGEVYLAEDTELGREVALKVLPPVMEDDPERLERFKREARAVASLNHPNIVTLFNVEQAEGRHLLVMERVEGKSLDRIIPPGGMPLAEVFDYAIPMADALAAAHEKGITHRDLKPANVMVTDEGQIKMLDFGLAKLASEASDAISIEGVATEAPTQSAALTGEGTVMGTAPYMSPEQLKGKEVDFRTDIFSFGILLYEMVTGKRPFQGDSGIELASSILKDTPSSVAEVRDDLPRHLGRIIQHCLEKDPERRFQSAKDIRNELDGLRGEIDSGQHPPSGSVPMVSGPVSSAAGPGSGSVVQQPGVSGPVSGPGTMVSGPESAVSGPATAVSGPQPVASRPWGLYLGIATVVIAAVLGVLWWQNRVPAENQDEGPVATTPVDASSGSLRSVAVLPFANLGADKDLDYLRLAVPDEIATALSRGSGLAIRPFSTTSRLDIEGSDPLELGRELGVASVITGQYFQEGEQLNLTLEAIDVAGNSVLWRDSVVASSEQLLSLRQAVSETVQQGLLPALDPQASLASTGTLPTNEEAYDLYLRSLPMSSDPAPNAEALALVQQAVKLDPNYAPAWAQLANRYHYSVAYGGGPDEDYDSAIEAAERALSLDPELLEAQVRKIIIGVERGELAAAYKASNRLIERRPKVGRAHFVRGYILRYAGAIEQSVEACDTALALDPSNPTFRSCGLTNSLAGRYDRALQFLELSPGTDFYNANRAVLFMRQDRIEEAVEAARPLSYPWEVNVLEAKREGRRLPDDQVQLIVDGIKSLRDAEQSGWAGVILAYAGEHEAGLELIREGIDRGYCSYPSMLTDPLLANLSIDPELADGWEEAVAAGKVCHERFLADTSA